MDKQNIKILVIDDNQENLLVIKSIIMSEFPTAIVLTALLGKIGLDMAFSEKPDAILMDILMPDMDGIEVCRLLKANDELSDIPVAYLTNVKGTNAMRIKAMEAGAAAYLEKPVTAYELSVQIRALLKLRAENALKRNENERLSILVEEHTHKLNQSHTATVKLLEELQTENQARKLTEDALRTSKELYISIINASPDFIVVTTLDGIILLLSSNTYLWSGYGNNDDIKGRNLIEFIAPNDCERGLMNLSLAIQGQVLGAIEYGLLRADGSVVETEINTEFTRDVDGNPNRIIFVIRDITNRKKTQRELQLSEKNYRFITEKITDVVWLMDLKGNSIFVSQSIENFTGYTVQEYLEQSLHDRFTRDSDILAVGAMRDEVLHYIQSEVLPPNYKKILYLDYCCKNGDVKTGEVIITPYFDEIKTLIGLHGVTRDVTQRKKAEVLLRYSEEKFRIIAEQSPIAIELFDTEGLLLNVNNACLELFGIVDATEIVGFKLFDDPNVSIAQRELIKKGESVNFQSEFDFDLVKSLNLYKTTRVGKVDLEMSITPIVKGGTEVTGYLVQIQDITLRKQAEDILTQTRLNYETFFNTIDDFLIVLDLDRNIIHANNTVIDRLNFNKEELFELSILDLHPTQRREETARVIEEIFQDITNTCTIPLVSKMGFQIPVETKVSRGFWNGSEVIFSVSKDVSKVNFSEEKFSKVFHVNPSACGLSDLTNKQYVEVNEAFYNLFGFDKTEVIGKTAIELGILDAQEIANIQQQTNKNGSVYNIESTLRAKNGAKKQVLISSENINVQDKAYRFTVVHDITERKLAEKNLKNVARLYALLSEINQAIVKCKNKNELFNTICNVAIQFGQFRMGWIGIYDELSGEIVPHYSAGHNEGFLDLLHLAPGNQDVIVGLSGMAFHQGEVLFCNDIAHDPLMQPWKEEALIRGYKSSFATPIFRGGKPYGTFTLYANEVGFFNDDEQKLLADIGKNISFAIDAIDSEVERIQVQQALADSENQYRNLIDNSPEAIAVYCEGKVIYVNNECVRLMRANSKEDLLGLWVIEFIHPDNRAIVMERMQKVAISPNDTSLPLVEEKYIRLDGTPIYVEVKAMPIMLDNKPAVQLTARDITDRKLVEAELENSRAELNAVYDYAPVMMCVVNEDRKIIFANKAFSMLNQNFENAVLSELLGGAIECINSFDNPLGCGFGVNCKVCKLKLAMENTFDTGNGHHNVEYQTNLFELGIKKEISFLVSTALINKDGKKKLLLCMIDITSRKEVEEALGESEEKFRLIAENTSDGIIYFDANGMIKYVSPSYIKQLGYSEQEELERTSEIIYSIMHPDDRDEVYKNLYESIKLKKSGLVYSYRINNIDGVYIWREDSAKFKYNNDGSYAGAYVSCRNISARKQAQEALQLSEIRLQNMFEFSPIAIWEEDFSLVKECFDELRSKGVTDFRTYFSNQPEKLTKMVALISIVAVNQTSLTVFGVENKEELLNGPVLSTSNANLTMFQEEFIALAEGKMFFEGETQIQTPKGERRDLLVNLTVMPGNENDLSKVLVSFIDITGRKQAEDALQQSEMFLRTFIDTSPFEIWARDVHSVGILENKKLVDHFGSILGKKPTDQILFKPKVIKLWEKNNERVLSGETIEEIMEYKVNTQTQLYHQITFPIINKSEIIGIAGFNIDITEQKRAEEALKTSQKKLKQFAAHLQDVREDEKKLLAREIHDELGQILVALKIDLGLLRQKVVKKLEITNEEDVITKFDHLYALVDDTIKTTRKIMTNLRPEVLDLLGFIEAVKLYAKEFQQRHKVTCELKCNVEKIDLSSQQAVALFRIVQESLTNVAKHAKATNVTIQLDNLDNNFVLEIKDNGIGMDENHKVRTDSYGMLGMKERVFLLEGKLSIVSKLGKGTSIKVEIPN